MTTTIQRSFAGGEISPALYARTDQTKYATGLRTCKNIFIGRAGGAYNRPGTKFVGEVKDSSKTVRLIPFVFNATQTYILEFGNLYMRVINAGSQVVEAAKAISAITAPGATTTVTTATHGYATGDEVYISGIVGETQLNGRNFKIVLDGGTPATKFKLQSMAGVDLNSTGYTTYGSGGNAYRVYTITTPYVEADLQELQFVQSADVLTIVHPNYAPRRLTRTGHTAWTLTAIDFNPSISAYRTDPTYATVLTVTAGVETHRYKVTRVKKTTLEESLTMYDGERIITNITVAVGVVEITVALHVLTTGDEVSIYEVGGTTELNGNKYTITTTGANTFTLDGIDGTSYGAYTTGGHARRTYAQTVAATAPSVATPISIRIYDPHKSEVEEYNIYREVAGTYGFIGTVDPNWQATAYYKTFVDIGYTPDTSDTPPIEQTIFASATNYPSTVAYHQQRLCFANSDTEPEKVWCSRVGQHTNFTIHSPLQDDDAVTFSLNGRQVNEVQHLLDLGDLVVLTTGGEWAIQGNASGVLTPAEINPKQHSYDGSNKMFPLIVGSDALYVQARGTIVRDLAYDYQVDGYRGNDLSIFSAHMFDGYSLRDWAHSQIPNSNVWIARSDGTLLGLTYVREHQLVAWHRHEFDGDVEQVCSVPKGSEDVLYLVVERTIGTSVKRYIEEMQTRYVGDIEDSIFIDSTLSLDGTNTAATTMTMSGGTTWKYDETITLTSSTASTFVAGDIGNEIHITGVDGTIIRFRIEGFTSGTVVTGKPNMTVPVAMRTTAFTTWGKAVDEVTGLWHLEGKLVSILGDGFVVASPNNEAYTTETVASGTVTLDKCYVNLHVGLPYMSDIETLNIDTTQGETLSDKRLLITKVVLHVESSRGVWVGAKPPTSDTADPLEGLMEEKIRNEEGYDDPVALKTGVIDLIIRGAYSQGGRVFIRQVDPVPMAILAVVPSGIIPVKG